MLLVHMVVDDSFLLVYGLAGTMFSQGLHWPEMWLKRRLAPDLIKRVESPDGWWPSKPQ